MGNWDPSSLFPAFLSPPLFPGPRFPSSELHFKTHHNHTADRPKTGAHLPGWVNVLYVLCTPQSTGLLVLK